MDFAYYVLLDVFSDRPFAGNQLAVFPDGSMVSSESMQKYARELNLAETVFVLPPEDSVNHFKFRIFTPLAELPFAGHPTVGTACALAELGLVKMTSGEASISVEEGVGPVPVLIRKSRDLFAAQFSVPRLPESKPGVPGVEAVARMLSLETHEVEEASAFSCGVPFLFVPVKNRGALSRVRLNTLVWEQETTNAWAREVYAFAREGNQIFARMFAPRLGISEDPATGAAAAALAGVLARDESKDAALSWSISQGVEMGRPSVISLEADVKDGRISAVRVGGKSVFVGEGKMRIVL
jgi:trans-2,3-dihydro-3-hydroxyanthranilate isomerase